MPGDLEIEPGGQKSQAYWVLLEVGAFPDVVAEADEGQVKETGASVRQNEDDPKKGKLDKEPGFLGALNILEDGQHFSVAA